ncbi:hypothetical protein [uncultured Thiodictyon sp.]|uniref:hypothetical protein n=1 Tax=uncultured Thiodictyon sp. TaxID=1846217 RepID=UPI0025F5F482|nr:hypothetical protein [uncultured Thiodictyon sp.]
MLWWTFDYDCAKRLHAYCRHPLRAPEPRSPDWTPDQGAVLLIDEIDKAEPDLPNGLLEVLGNGAFTVPYLDASVRHQVGPPPLVVITANPTSAIRALNRRNPLTCRHGIGEGRHYKTLRRSGLEVGM